MKKLFIIAISFMMILSVQVNNIYANDTKQYSIDNYLYEIYENSNERCVNVIDKTTNNIDYIVYNKDTGMLLINGKNQNCYVEESLNNSSRTVTNAANCKINFTVDFQTVGLLAGAILAITAVASAASTCGVSIATFKIAVSQITNAYSCGSLVSFMAPGAKVKGYFKYTLQRNSNGTSRYANRSLTMKFGSGPNKTYSFGNGGWWSSTKPYSLDKEE